VALSFLVPTRRRGNPVLLTCRIITTRITYKKDKPIRFEGQWGFWLCGDKRLGVQNLFWPSPKAYLPSHQTDNDDEKMTVLLKYCFY
jgi:hypothetical protein